MTCQSHRRTGTEREYWSIGGRVRQPVQNSHQRVRIMMPTMPRWAAVGTQEKSAKKARTPGGAGRKPLRTLNATRCQNMAMVATQARQHHRHSELIRYSDWN